jgi:hypothetical protein
MNDSEIDEVLERRIGLAHPLDPALLKRVSGSIGDGLRPVRPLGPVWVLASLLTLVSALIAVTGASSLGLYGIRNLSGAELGAIFPALAIFTWLAALLCVAQTTPGGFRWKNPRIVEPVMTNPPMFILVILAGWLAVDALLFRDYGMNSLVPAGIPCLRAGLIVAIPTGFGIWILLRRGFAVNPVEAGLAAGTLAGLAGLTMLELHCPNFLALHVMVWHTAVIPISALVGALLARIAARLS